ncbi:unnamed protein product, partial [Brenthis ino]
MEMKLNLLLYLEKRRILYDMKTACEYFVDQLNEKSVSKFPPLRYLLEVDVMNLIETFPELGDYFVKEPLNWQRHCNEILYACLKSLDNDMIQYVQSTQVNVNIRLTSFPSVFCNPNRKNYKGVTLLQGLLVEITKPTNYVYHSVWSCPDECDGNEVILQYIPKIPPKCCLCKRVLFENSGLRRCGDQVRATFKFKYDLLSKTFTIVDDLIKKLKLGGKYFMHAIILKKYIAIWSIEEVLPLPAPITSPISPDIKSLYDSCYGVPWKFIYCLASSFGVHTCPLNCFMNVKINILLSLTSIKAHFESNSPILHILVGGLDTGYAGRLMTQAATLADSYTLLGMSQNAVTSALIASSGGVCLLPSPLQNYSRKQIHSILSIIESGEISQGPHIAKLRCAIWAQGMDFKKMIISNIGSVFGNICRGDYGEWVNEVADNNLENAVNPPGTIKEEIQSLRDVSIYINVIAGIRVSLTEETEMLLHNYFLAARKSPMAVTIGSLGALVTSCATCARLCRRSVASVQDAIFAIWLHISGMPEQRIAPEECLETPADIKKFDKVMKKFITWLEQFIGCSIL